MTTNDGLAVRTEGAWKIFEHDGIAVEAVRDVTLEVKRGEFLAMAGPSGSGKTTLLNLIGGLTRPTRGRVFIDGQDLTDMSENALAQLRLERVGFIFQAYNLLPVLTALENAEFSMLLRGVEKGERYRRVSEMFDTIGIGGLEDRWPNKLSGGQQQRVAVVRAVIGEPAIVLADEPTANLDSASSKTLLDIMERFNRDLGTTFLFCTHDPRVMERSRRLINLVDGAIESDRPVAPAG
jgi:putative ABC transport system ATP-binding protein